MGARSYRARLGNPLKDRLRKEKILDMGRNLW